VLLLRIIIDRFSVKLSGYLLTDGHIQLDSFDSDFSLMGLYLCILRDRFLRGSPEEAGVTKLGFLKR
jgi:hypothetical protein